jgi:hypothetical protein
MATKLHTLWLRAQLNPVNFQTEPEEVQPLGALINWERLLKYRPSPVFLDPCAGPKGAILAALSEEVPALQKEAHMINNDINTSYPTQLHFDALNPVEWDVAPPNIDIIVTSPPFQLLDPFLGECLNRANLFTCIHCPADYVSNGPVFRRTLWSWLQQQDLTAAIRGLPRAKDRNTRRCSWIIIFKTPLLNWMLWQSTIDCFTLCTI